MSARHIASISAVLGGIAWLATVVLVATTGGEGGTAVAATYWAGLVLLTVAAGAGGYTLVETAPLWLRAVVVVAAPLLLFTAVTAVDEAIEAVASPDGWFAAELTVLVTAIAAGVVGAVKLLRLTRSAAAPGRGTVER